MNWMKVYAKDAPRMSPKDRRALGYHDPVFFSQYYLHELFPLDPPWIHRVIWAVLTGKCRFLEKYGDIDKIIRNCTWTDGDGHKHQLFYRTSDGALAMNLYQRTLLMLPRGLSKTTIAGIGVPTWEIEYQETPLTLYLSESGTHAKAQLLSVKDQVTWNERLVEDFGNLKPKLSDDERWAADMFETTTGVAMAGRGRGAQVRGINHKGKRPRRIIFDDVEDKESVKTQEQRRKAIEWLYGDVFPAVPSVDKDWRIVGLGTLLSGEAAMAKLQMDPEWACIVFGATDKDGELLWPEWNTHEELEKRKQAYARQGLLHIFYMEYFNKAVAPETQVFRQEYFRYGVPDEPLIRTAIYTDPAISSNRTADRTWIIVVGMTEKGKIYVLDCWAKRGASPRELIDQYFSMARRFKCNQINGHGLEAVQYQAALAHLMREEMFRKNWFFDPVLVTHSRRGANAPPQKKEERIQFILQARYSSGYITHVRPFPELEAEMLDFSLTGGAKHDDGPDCLAGAVSMLDPTAPLAAGVDLSAPSYPDLDEVLGHGWEDWTNETTNLDLEN